MFKDLLYLPFRCVRAFSLIIGDKKLLTYCMVPFLIGLATFFLSVVGLVIYRNDIVAAAISPSHEWLTLFISSGFVIVGIVFSGVVSFLVTLACSSFFIEAFVETLLIRQGLKLTAEVKAGSLLRTILHVGLDTVQRLICIGAIGAVLIVIGFIPLFSLPVLLISAFLTGANLIDTPLTLVGYRFSHRWRWALHHTWWCVLMGAVLMLAMIIPLGATILLPLLLVISVDKLKEGEVTSNKE